MKFMNIENAGIRLGSVHRDHTSFQENDEFQSSLGYIMSGRIAWQT